MPIPWNVCIKKQFPAKGGTFVERLPQNITTTVPERYEEINALLNPVIDRQYQNTSSVQEMFRAMEPVPEFTTVALHRGTDLVPGPTQRVFWSEDDDTPFLRQAHTPRNHYAESMFIKDFIQCTKALAWS